MRFLSKPQPKREKRGWFTSKKTRREQLETTKKDSKRSCMGILILWGLFLATALYIALYSSYIRIGRIAVYGTEKIASETVRDFIDRELSGKFLGIVPRDGFFAVREAAIEADIENAFPLFSDVSITRGFPDRIDVNVVERTSIMLWCSQEKCFLLDESGMLRENERVFSEENSTFVLKVTDLSERSAEAGQKVFDWDFSSFVGTIQSAFLNRLGLGTETSYKTASRFAEDIRVRTDEGWEAYLSTRVPAEVSAGILNLLFEKELPKEKRSGLKYIDLRTENRIYYAFQDGVEQAAGTSGQENAEKQPDSSKIEKSDKKKPDR